MQASGFELANGSFTNLPIDLAKFALNRLPLAFSRIFRRRPGNYVDGLLSPFQRISFGPLASSFPSLDNVTLNDVSSIADQTRKFAPMVLGTNWFEHFIQDFKLFVAITCWIDSRSVNILTLCAFNVYVSRVIYARFRNLRLIRARKIILCKTHTSSCYSARLKKRFVEGSTLCANQDFHKSRKNIGLNALNTSQVYNLRNSNEPDSALNS